MNWKSLDDFLQMGGYGLYVWGSYGVSFALMAAEALLARRRHRRGTADALRASNADHIAAVEGRA